MTYPCHRRLRRLSVGGGHPQCLCVSAFLPEAGVDLRQDVLTTPSLPRKKVHQETQAGCDLELGVYHSKCHWSWKKVYVNGWAVCYSRYYYGYWLHLWADCGVLVVEGLSVAESLCWGCRESATMCEDDGATMMGRSVGIAGTRVPREVVPHRKAQFLIIHAGRPQYLLAPWLILLATTANTKSEHQNWVMSYPWV